MDEILSPEQWYELQGRILQQYPHLTDAELQYHEAAEQDMMAMVEFSLQKAKALLQEALDGRYHITRLKHYWRSGRINRKRMCVS